MVAASWCGGFKPGQGSWSQEMSWKKEATKDWVIQIQLMLLINGIFGFLKIRFFFFLNQLTPWVSIVKSNVTKHNVCPNQFFIYIFLLWIQVNASNEYFIFNSENIVPTLQEHFANVQNRVIILSD